MSVSKRRSRAQTVEQEYVVKLAKDLVTRLAMLLKTARIHSVNNSALRYSVRIFVESCNELLRHLGDFAVRGDNESIFINEHRVRPEALLFEQIVALMGELARRGSGGLNCNGTVTPPAVRSLIQVMLDHPRLDQKKGVDILNEALAKRGVATLRFIPRLSLITDLEALEQEEGGSDTVAAAASHSVNAYTNLLVNWKAYILSTGIEVQEAIRTRLQHAVQAAVDVLLEDPQWFLAAALTKVEEPFRVVHAVNMTFLSLCIGRELELGRRGLMNLGLAALFADSGMRLEPKDALPGDSPRHPLASVQEILQVPSLAGGQRDRIMAAYEHHIARDGSGFPASVGGKSLHTFSSIIAVADAFDHLTSDLPGRPAASPSRALELIAADEKRFDPRLVRIFIHVLGPFPLSTAVLLSTGETAIVCRHARDPHLRARPQVKIVRDRKGEPVPPTTFDLTEVDARGNFVAHIVRALPPGDLKIDLVDALFSNPEVLNLPTVGEAEPPPA